MNDTRPHPRQGPQAARPRGGPGGDRAGGGDLHRQGDPADRRLRHRPGAPRRGRPRARPGRRPRRRPRRAVRRRQGRPARHHRRPPALRGRAADPPRPATEGAVDAPVRPHAPTSNAPSCSSPACCCSPRPAWPGRRCPPWEHKAAFRRSWLAGFRQAIGRRLARRRDAGRGRGRDRFSARARPPHWCWPTGRRGGRSRWRRAYPDLGTARPRHLSGSGGAEGWAAGQRADLGGTALTAIVAARGRR